MSAAATGNHWEHIFESRPEADRSWTQPVPTTSLTSIARSGVSTSEPIIDIGGGAARLVDHLLANGHTDLTVLDVSRSALCQARARVGHDAPVEWIHADITTWTPSRQYTLWHDRAVFHFLVDAADVEHYCRISEAGVAPGGHMVIATFAPDGPTSCSGLPVRRWSAAELSDVFSGAFEAVTSETVEHQTPGGGVQPFTWVTLRRSA